MISKETVEIATRLYDGAKAGPVRDKLLQLISCGDWKALVNTKVKPGDYTDSESYWSDNLICSFLRKNEDIVLDIDLEAEALERFIKAEFQCFQTNRRLNALLLNFSQEKVDVAAREILTRCRKIIREIVGSGPRESQRAIGDISGEIPHYVHYAAHGPGATLSDPSTRCTAPDKFESVPTMTASANPLLVDWVSTKWGSVHAERCGVQKGRSVKIVKGGTFFTVHKTALARRICEKQPSINVWYQKGLGVELRKLFRPYVDLRTAKAHHEKLALWASRTGSHATLDLEQASDTVARLLVKACWPSRWFEHMNALATRVTLLPDGREWRLEKFSSMGNGFTFELESITFYALSLAAAGYDGIAGSFREIKRGFSVLGDDIICPTEHAREVSSVLEYFGFTLNREKSFTSGPFRESCGSDAFDGVPVRGFFLEKSLEQPADLISCLNALRRACLIGDEVSESRWSVVKKAWHYCRGLLPRNLRNLYGPSGLGDQVIHAPESEWRSRVVNSIREFRAYQPAAFTQFDLEKHWNQEVVLASKLYGISSQSPKGNGETLIVPRGDPLGYRIAWVPFS